MLPRQQDGLDMAKELAFVLINPYTISKSRTGGVIGRFIARTGLEVVAARMFGPSRQLAERYADLLRSDPEVELNVRQILADYVLNNYSPDPKTGRPRRVLMLLFEGEDAIATISNVTGNIRYTTASADTVRDTYGDLILDDNGKVRYFEPAVLIGPTRAAVEKALQLWAEYSESDGGLIESAVDLPPAEIQKTLVLIKPDNFQFPSARPGNIIDLFSASGLRIIGAKVYRMSVAEAEEFYGPVRAALREKLKDKVAERAAAALSKEFGFEIPPDVQKELGALLGPVYGDDQFNHIVQFMTGFWPPSCAPDDAAKPGQNRSLALVYAGRDAVNKIRSLLGPTDPKKAKPGQVRREFGQDIMVNAAHASDSPENAAREMKIVRVERDDIRPIVKKYYP
jgi:nucleoside diphosphate kinase